MAVTNYYMVGGFLVAEETAGSRQDYHFDALGSVAAQTDSNQVVTVSGRYAVYGSTYWSSGARESARFSWCGSWGYRKTQGSSGGLRYAETYVRARHYSATGGRWTTMDPMWPAMTAYTYAKSAPSVTVDPSGRKPVLMCNSNNAELQSCCDKMSGIGRPSTGLSDPNVRAKVKACMHYGVQVSPPYRNDLAIDTFMNQVGDYCSPKGKSVCVRCFDQNDEFLDWPKHCYNPCKEGYWGYCFGTNGKGSPNRKDYGDDFCGLWPLKEECPEARGIPGEKNECDCGIVLCQTAFSRFNDYQSPCAIFFHEIAHCSMLGHRVTEQPPKWVKYVPRSMDFIYKLGCCLCLVLDGPTKCKTECKKLLPNSQDLDWKEV